MALGSGISYRDWVIIAQDDSKVNLSVVTGTTVITTDNLASTRVKEISRITPDLVGFDKVIEFELEMDSPVYTNIHNRASGMTIGVISLQGYNHGEMYISAILKDSAGGVLHTQSEKHITEPWNPVYLFMDTVITGVYLVELKIRIVEVLSFIDVDIGRLWIGGYIEADFDNTFGFSHGHGAKAKYSIDNDAHLRFKTPRKEMSFDFLINGTIHTVFGTGVESWYDLSKWTSTNRDLIVLPKVSTDEELSYLGTYGLLPKPVNIERLSGAYWSADFNIVELV